MTLGKAIAQAIAESPVRTQEALAELLGVDQTTVSKMIRGAISVTVDRVRVIEDLCDLPRGQILRWAGYVANTDHALDALETEIVKRERRTPPAATGRRDPRSARGGR